MDILDTYKKGGKLVKTCHFTHARRIQQTSTNATHKKGGRGGISKPKVERFTLLTIAETLRGSDLLSARSALSFAVGAVLDVSGKVQKAVRRDGKCKLVIEPGDVPGFVVFADCLSDAKLEKLKNKSVSENLRKPKIRKGSRVSVRGKLKSFGVRAVCLSDCSF